MITEDGLSTGRSMTIPEDADIATVLSIKPASTNAVEDDDISAGARNMSLATVNADEAEIAWTLRTKPVFTATIDDDDTSGIGRKTSLATVSAELFETDIESGLSTSRATTNPDDVDIARVGYIKLAITDADDDDDIVAGARNASLAVVSTELLETATVMNRNLSCVDSAEVETATGVGRKAALSHATVELFQVALLSFHTATVFYPATRVHEPPIISGSGLFPSLNLV